MSNPASSDSAQAPEQEPQPYVVSEQLSALEGDARAWLTEYQAPFEAKLKDSPRYRVDLAAGTLSVGDVLFDDLRAKILCSVGIEDPNQHVFYPALRIDGYPEALAAGMRKAANVGPLIDLPEVRAAELPNICPEMIWTFAALCARAADGQAIHVIDAEDVRHYLVLGEVEYFDVDHSKLTEEQARDRIADLVRPIAHQLAVAFSPQMMELAPVEQVLEQIEAALGACDQMSEEFKRCATHAEMIGSEHGGVFSSAADDLKARLDAIETLANEDVAKAIPLVSDLAIALEGLIAEGSRA